MARMATDCPPSTSEKAFSFISKGWKDVREGANADLKLMRARANKIKEPLKGLASSFDREWENLMNTSSTNMRFNNNNSGSNVSLQDLEFFKKLKPKFTELRRVYSSPDFTAQYYGEILSKWGPSSSIDLSAIKRAFGAEQVVDDDGFYLENGSKERRIVNGGMKNNVRRRVITRVSEVPAPRWKSEEVLSLKEWEPFRVFKDGLKDLDKRADYGKSASEFIENVKKNLKITPMDSQDAKDVPPLDVPELLASLVKQSEPLLDQLGVKKDICEKAVDMLCNYRRKDQLDINSGLSKDSMIATRESNSSTDELDNRIASVLQSTGYRYQAGPWNDSVEHNLEEGKRNVAIITTASLPWMTGTAINPLFRAAYLAKNAKQNVTLLVPWLCKEDQELVYPNKLTFDSPEEQEAYVRNWLESRTGFKSDFKIAFYPGKFSRQRRSIIAVGDTSQFIPDKEADIAVLEEPEHLNWYYHGKRWTDKFSHVVGVVHTNYLEYIKREKNGALQAFFVKHINNWISRAYCHKILRLSASTQDLPKSIVCNVHGVCPKFLEVGRKVAMDREVGEQSFSKGAYFLGKMVWGKGYRELVDLLVKHKDELNGFNIDVFGNGEDSLEVQSAAKKLALNMKFHQGRDHADELIHGYKVFINPSISDVLCTATAEALAMGKIVICADHPSNEFFGSFPNCLMYKTSEEFVNKVKEALAAEPVPLSAEQQYQLSWDAATERFIANADLYKVPNNRDNVIGSRGLHQKLRQSVSMPNLNALVDNGLALAHFCLTGNEALRLATGAIPGTQHYDEQHCRDLNLLPPSVQQPVYLW
ncbi:digalactosyldiacylglycerol synthase 1, chloroplastic [Cryptomeria japonica]|uniref:digalactosyldiacylglycerol synthase 1, chloroplastic n=1 Tax=Cryptomeria japonica TaxID=3369 RepID=UPI0027DA51CC|nr:digalactosyldiacylglycerol synthase 1, chloroplastic [Cryptomeria japonica]